MVTDDPAIMLVPLANGKGAAKIDTVDAALVGRFNWYRVSIHGIDYAQAFEQTAAGRSTIYLHRLIGKAMGLPAELQIDHRHHDGLDCRRSELRSATNPQNAQNARRQRNTRTGLKGVHPRGQRYRALIRVGGRLKTLGSYPDPQSAATAYDREAEAKFGEFALTNAASGTE
jgi:hypothetical protein